jgi:hypothetical protein
MTILAELFQESAQLEAEILANLKDQIRSARIKAALAVNRELVLLYWRIGRRILK